MASEFYEQLGVDRLASSTKIRTAYGQHVARLAKRRKALVEQGGDTTQLDLLRARLDEAWEVLSDPLRRRRYDMLLRWTDGTHSKTVDGLWEEISDGLVHPAAAVGAKLLRVTSRLAEIGVLPLPPSGSPDEPPTLVPHEDDLTTPRAARLSPARAAEGRESAHLKVVDGAPGTSDVLVMPSRAEAAPSQGGSEPAPQDPDLAGQQVTAAPQTAVHPSASPAASAPPAATTAPPTPPRSAPPGPVLPPGLPPDEIGLLVDQHGYSGFLLQAVRLRMGLTLQDLSDHTRISVRYLEALESETRDSLPTATFVRGYVREVARLLKLPVENVVAGYLRRLDR